MIYEKTPLTILALHASKNTPVFKKVSLQEHIHYCLKILIFSPKNTHPLFPELGTTFHTLFYRPFLMHALNQLNEDIFSCIQRFEPRITDLKSDLKKDRFYPNIFFIQLRYRIIEIGQEDFLDLHFSTQNFYANC